MRARLAKVLAICLIMVGCAPVSTSDSTIPTTPGSTSTGTAGVTTTTGSLTSSEEPPATTLAETTLAETTLATSLDDLTLAYQPVLEIDEPIIMTARPGEAAFLATKAGVISRLGEDGGLGATVLDISGQIENAGERGFLGLALHPTDPNRMFVHYSAAGSGATIVSEFALDQEGVSHPESEQVLLTVDQPAGNHNGGMIQFGPDEALYLGLGDGGGAGDQFGNAQNPDTLLGGLVRIDVDSGESSSYAIGLRNPWRFWIDDDLIYIGDVGQGAYEEIDVATMEAGHNFGWNVTEGLHCFSPPEGCDTSGFTLPVLEVAHDDAGTCSITGGVVYRGQAIPMLEGHYFYSDYCGGWMRSFRFVEDGAVDQRDWTEQVGTPGRVLSFGVDGDGEIYVLTESQVLRIVPA